MQRAFDIFQELLMEIHIPTKTTDSQFHKDSEEAYEIAFDIAHLVAEMDQDIGEAKSVDEDEVGPRAYELVEELKTILEDEISSNDDIGKDTLLRDLYKRLNGVCGTMRQYAKEEKDDEGE